MMPNWRGGKTVTIQRRAVTGQDGLGNDIRGTVGSEQVQAVLVPLAIKSPPRATRGGSPAEELQGEVLVAAGLTCFLPPGTAIAVEDQVIVDGETWRVDGVPGSWSSPFTGVAGPVQAELVRVTG